MQTHSSPLFEAPLAPITPPPLIDSKPLPLDAARVPYGQTLCVRIPLGDEGPAPAMTGIFIPRGYRLSPRIDLILYLQGNHRGDWQPPPSLSIDGYWNRARYPYFAFREQVADSGKNVILVAPTLGPRSQAGRLVRRGGFDWYMDQVLAALAMYGPFRGAAIPPQLGSIILACHSGGGDPMRQLACSGQRSAAQIQECWGFDCLYARRDDIDATLWAQWARARPAAKVYIYYLGSTADQSRKLWKNKQRMSLNNVSVEKSSAREHNFVPITHWMTRIQAAPFLARR